MGPGAAEDEAELAGLNGLVPPYLLAYDAEYPGCRAMVDWVQRRDRRGLVVSFPFQNPELVHVAPELAGLPLIGQVVGYDTRTRRVDRGARILPNLFRRLPGLAWLAPFSAIPPLSSMICAWLRRS